MAEPKVERDGHLSCETDLLPFPKAVAGWHPVSIAVSSTTSFAVAHLSKGEALAEIEKTRPEYTHRFIFITYI